MSLEESIDALRVAVEKNNELLTILTSKAQTGLAAKTGETTASSAAPAEEPKRGRGRPPKEEAEKPAKVPTQQEMADATVKFLEVDDDDEFNARKGLVKTIVKKHGVAKMSEIPEGDRAKALAALVAYKAGDPTGYEPKRDTDDMA